MQKRKKFTVPPLRSQFMRNLNGKDELITLRRQSWLCKLLRVSTVIIGNTIHFRSMVVTREMFDGAVKSLEERKKMGFILYIWTLLTK
jgi:hypothetical protein